MNFLEKVFNWMLVIGLALLVGRIMTVVFLFLDVPFTIFFKDTNVISFIILIVGAIGSKIMKGNKK